MPTLEDFEECRTLRHSWEKLDAGRLYDPVIGVVSVLRIRCTRCTMVRTDELDHDGDLVSRAYLYPDGYRLAATDERPTLQDLRVRLLQRMKEN